MPTHPPPMLPLGVASSMPPEPHEPTIFTHWDSVLEKVGSASKSYVQDPKWAPPLSEERSSEVVTALRRLFHDISLSQYKLHAMPDLSMHVEPEIRFMAAGVLSFRLQPKTHLGRRYIVSRQQ